MYPRLRHTYKMQFLNAIDTSNSGGELANGTNAISTSIPLTAAGTLSFLQQQQIAGVTTELRLPPPPNFTPSMAFPTQLQQQVMVAEQQQQQHNDAVYSAVLLSGYLAAAANGNLQSPATAGNATLLSHQQPPQPPPELPQLTQLSQQLTPINGHNNNNNIDNCSTCCFLPSPQQLFASIGGPFQSPASPQSYAPFFPSSVSGNSMPKDRLIVAATAPGAPFVQDENRRPGGTAVACHEDMPAIGGQLHLLELQAATAAAQRMSAQFEGIRSGDEIARNELLLTNGQKKEIGSKSDRKAMFPTSKF